jgi:hypothetical protein
MQSESFTAEITEDTRLKGEATPGTHTPCVDVPIDEVEDADGKVVSSNPDRMIYDLKARGMSWKEVTDQTGMNSPWMKAKKFASENGLPYPPEIVQPPVSDQPEVSAEPVEDGIQETVSDATESEPFLEEQEEEQPASLPPVLPTYKLYDLSVNKEIEKTSIGHTHTLEFRIGTSTVRLGLHGIPTEPEIQKMMARENRRFIAGR